MLEKLSPILPARDLGAAQTFWARLGLGTDCLDTAEYLLMKRDGAEVHVCAAPALNPTQNDHGTYLRPADIRALHAEWAALGLPDRGIPRYVALANRPWGMVELAVIDRDGNLVRAEQELPLG